VDGLVRNERVNGWRRYGPWGFRLPLPLPENGESLFLACVLAPGTSTAKKRSSDFSR